MGKNPRVAILGVIEGKHRILQITMSANLENR